MLKDIVFFENSVYFKKLEIQGIYINKDKPKKINDLVMTFGTKNNRSVVEKINIDILISPEKEVKRDSLHHRNSGLDQIICRLAKKNRIAIGFSFSSILNSKNPGELLGRMMQNVRFCRKFKVRMILGSFANNEFELRNKAVLAAFGACIGMSGKEIKKALDLDSLIKKKRNYVCKGVELID